MNTVLNTPMNFKDVDQNWLRLSPPESGTSKSVPSSSGNLSLDLSLATPNPISKIPKPESQHYHAYKQKGSQILTDHENRNAIDSWFENDLKGIVLAQRRIPHKIYEEDLIHTWKQVDLAIKYVFFGFLSTHKEHLQGKSNSAIVDEGFNFLKNYFMNGWGNLNMEEVAWFKGKQVFNRWSKSETVTPQNVFIHLMNLQSGSKMSIAVLEKLVDLWKAQYRG